MAIVVHVTKVFASPAIMSRQRYASPEYETTAPAPNGYVTRGGLGVRDSILSM